ncbi:ATP-binding protein, partial [Pontiella sp.]
DNGNGTGFGLFSIRERLEHIDGTIRIESNPGEGTKIMMIFPLDLAAIS